MKRCFGYARVSTQKQGEGVSLEAQKDAIAAFAARNDIDIAQWFEEKVTAAKSGRPIFNAMLRLLARGKAQGVVMHKIDRSARNFADWARIGDLSDAGIDVHFASESLDFRSRGGRLAADIQAVIAADYIRNLRDETIKGIRGRLKQGLCPWGAPLGYLDAGKGKPKTLDPVRAPLVRKLFELYASGTHSIVSLQAEMRRRGLRNTLGNPVSKGGIETILSNPFYCGILKLRGTGETFPGIHEALIPASLFRAVQDRKAGKAGKKVTKHNHLFAGLFQCAVCRTAMIPERQKGHVYYRCHSRSCPVKSVREEHLEERIREELRAVQFTEEQRLRLAEAIDDWCKGDTGRHEEDALRLAAAQLEVRERRLTDLLLDDVVSRDQFAAKQGELVIERAEIAERLAAMESARPTAADAFAFLELVTSLERRYISADRPTKRRIVELATSNRLIGEKYIETEPRNWLLAPSFLIAALEGAPLRPTSRTTRDIPSEHMKQLFEAMREEGAAKLLATLAGELDEMNIWAKAHRQLIRDLGSPSLS